MNQRNTRTRNPTRYYVERFGDKAAKHHFIRIARAKTKGPDGTPYREIDIPMDILPDLIDDLLDITEDAL